MDEQKLKKAISLTLKKFREERKLSQEKLALMANIDSDYVGMLERELRNPSLYTLSKISKALNITMVELVAEIEKQTEN